MGKPVIRRHVDHAKIRHFRLPSGLPDINALRDELEDMREVLLGHVEPPMTMGIMTMLEVAEAYFSRACDIEQQILRAHAEKRSTTAHDKFRASEIRSFKEQAKSAAELGSRRVTAANMRMERERLGRETGG